MSGDDMQTLIARLVASGDDVRLSDDEKAALTQALRDAAPPEEGLRRLRNRAFELARERSADAQAFGLIRWLEGIVRALDVTRQPAGSARSEAFFSPGEACLNAILQRLRAARSRIDIAVFTLSDDRIAAEVLAAHGRGVALRVITDNEKELDRGSDIPRLRTAGVPIAVDRSSAHMHHKFAIFDGRWLLNGSYNWTRSACQHNEENVVLSSDPALVRQFGERFEALWQALRID